MVVEISTDGQSLLVTIQVCKSKISFHDFLSYINISDEDTRNFLYRDMKYGRNCLSHAAQFTVPNGRKRSPTFHESINISYLGYYQNR